MGHGKGTRFLPMVTIAGSVATLFCLRIQILYHQDAHPTKALFKSIQVQTILVQYLGMALFGAGVLIPTVNLGTVLQSVQMFLFKFQVLRMLSA
jgi:hypothetical protein